MRLVEVNGVTVIEMQLFDGDTGQFPRVRVYDNAGTEQTGAPFSSPINLTHRANGLYTATVTPTAEGEFVLAGIVYSDSGHTTINKKYNQISETWVVRSVDQDLATLLSRLTSGRATNLDNLDATISSRAAAATALSTAQWTNTRAANLDNLDAAVSSRLSTAGYTAPDNAGIATLLTRLSATRASNLDNLDAAITTRAPSATALSTAVWTNGRAVLIDNLDAAITTRAPSATALSTVQWTNTRAALLDNLDAAVTTRAPAATALSTAIWTNTRAGNLDNLDAAVTTRAPSATALSTAQWTNLRAANLDNLDAAVSTRLSTAGYTAPDNAGIATLLTRLSATRASNLDNLDAAITTRAPSATALSTAQWTNGRATNLDNLDALVSSRLPTSSYTAPDNAGIATTIAQTTPTAIENSVWDASQAAHTGVGTTGESLNSAGGTGLTPGELAAIADAVWDEATSGHLTAGTFGAKVASYSEVNIANEVWNSLRATHVVAGSFGEALQGVLSTTRAGLIDNLTRLDVVVSTRAQETTLSDVLADTNALELRLTAPRAANLDNLDATISSRASQASIVVPPTVGQIADAVWDEAQADHLGAGTTGKSLSDGTAVANPAAIADAVWDELQSGHAVVGSFGAFLNAAITSRASDADMQAIKGAGFVSTDSLHQIKLRVDALPSSAGDATLANQNTIISALAGKASQASVNTLQTSVNAIPTNPLLTTDGRLNNLDATISSRLSAVQFDVIKGAGFNPATDTLEAIRDAIAASVDLSPVLTELDAMKGAGFNTGTDSLKQISDRADSAITAANAAAASAASADANVASKASQVSVNTLQTSVNAIPTNPALTTDPRFANLDATISSRASAANLAAAMGGTFNPGTDSLENIYNTIAAFTFGDATLANQTAILAAITALASQASVNAIQASVNAIPINPLLTTDPRLNNLDAAISTRALETTLSQIKGGGFNGSTDTLEAIRDAIASANLDLTPVLAGLAEIKGAGFTTTDDLQSLNQTAVTERAQIKADTAAFAAQGEGV